MGSPPVFDSSGYSFGVLEDASLVGSVHATDPDSDIIDYSLSGSDSGNFSIDSSGNISAYMLDFESQITHYFDVTVTDMMGNSATASVSVVVGDVDEDPVFDAAAYSFGVLEDATVVGTVVATDPQNDIIDYSLSGPDAGNFNIDSSGIITAYMLDFESQVTHYFDVTVTDMMGNSATVPVSVVVSDVDENPVFGAPVAPATAFEFTISEMAHNDDVVGGIPVSDPQDDLCCIEVYGGDINDPMTWVLSDAFKATDVNGTATITVNNEWSLDHETKIVHNLILQAVDAQGNTATTGATITLTDEVEWGGMGVFVVSWPVLNQPAHHTELLIIPQNQAAYENDPIFANTAWVDRQEVHYTTVGAEGAGFLFNTLVSSVNRRTINEDSRTSRGTVWSEDEDDLIDMVFQLDANYDDDLNYDFVPQPGTNGYNSNSYLRGLLNALEAEFSASWNVDLGGLDFPGWNKPLPLSEFGV